MKKRIFGLTVLFSLAVIVISSWFYFSAKDVDWQDKKSTYIVALNEISKLSKSGNDRQVQEKIAALQEDMRFLQEQESGVNFTLVICVVSVLFFMAAFGYIYLAVLRPFDEMKDFAVKISAGDFSVPLKYQRSNYFGEFTWAFDSMRKEITRARVCEREAIDNNKTVIATLSHDIKTPIASIRAYAEALGASMDSSYEKRERYVSVIIKKCDEVSGLTDDLFLHSISDLDKLKIMPEKLEVCSFMENIIEDISSSQGDVKLRGADFATYVNADRNRLTQIAENLINNARKYARSDMEVFITKDRDSVELHFRDYGSGIPDKDMPFIFDKFYRGGNCGNEQGSGLGLYIVKYIAEKMDGSVALTNHSNGLEVVVTLPEYGSSLY